VHFLASLLSIPPIIIPPSVREPTTVQKDAEFSTVDTKGAKRVEQNVWNSVGWNLLKYLSGFSFHYSANWCSCAFLQGTTGTRHRMMTKVMLAICMKSSTPSALQRYSIGMRYVNSLARVSNSEGLAFKGADQHLRVPFGSTIIAFGGTRQIAIKATMGHPMGLWHREHEAHASS
jgi:hypothetical protein